MDGEGEEYYQTTRDTYNSILAYNKDGQKAGPSYGLTDLDLFDDFIQ